MIRLAWIAPVLLLGGSVAAYRPSAQAPAPASPETGRATIAGRVIDGTTNLPVRGALVTIDTVTRPANAPFGAGPSRPGVLTDSQGRFVYERLPGGSFTLRAEANGSSGAFGQARPGGQRQTIDLTADERILDATIRIWRGGSLTGTVADEAGDPIVGAMVIGWRRSFVGGRQRFTNAGVIATTDDRGMYRIAGLDAGEYAAGASFQLATFPMSFVEDPMSAKGPMTAGTSAPPMLVEQSDQRLVVPPSFASMRLGSVAIGQPGGPFARVADGRVWAFVNTFAPASMSVDRATLVTLGAGEDRAGVDIRVKSMPLVSVSGTVTTPNGPASLGLRLAPAVTEQFRSPDLVTQGQAVSDANGRFTIAGVPPGQYTLGPPSSSSVSGSTPVTVGDRDVTGVALTIRSRVTLTGRIEFEGSRPRPPANQVRLSLDRSDALNLRPAINVTPDGALKSSLPPGQYFVRLLTGPGQSTLGMQAAGWTLKSAMLNGHDVVDEPFAVQDTDITGLVVTFTDRPSTVTGVVHDTQGAADASASILVFPTDKTTWVDFGAAPRRLGLVRVDRKGAFSISGLPPGEYFVMAIPDELAGPWQDRAVLEAVSRVATRVRVTDGQSTSIDLRTVRR